MDTNELKAIIESLIFVSENPLSIDEIKSVLEEVEKPVIKTTVDELIEEYNREDKRAFYIKEVAGGYQFRTKPKFAPWIQKFNIIKPRRLSQAALETLAIVAYNQPVVRSQVEQIRGVDSGGVLSTLLDKKLIRIMGKKDGPGRPMVYGTTKEFLEIFDLKTLSDLPTLKELDEIKLKEPMNEVHNGEAPEDNSKSGDSIAPEGRGAD